VIGATLDVLCIGAAGAAEYEDLRDAGLQVERAGSLVEAMERLRTARVVLVVVDGEICAYRERDVFSSLRDAGVSASIALYPQSLAWRAARAIEAGADDAFALPAAPGAVRARATSLIAAARRARGPTSGGLSDAMALQSLVADVSVINRSVGDLDRALDQVLRCFERRSGATRCSLLLVDTAHGELTVAKSVGFPDAAPRPPVPVGRGPAGEVAKSGAPLLAADVAQLREFRDSRPRPSDAASYRTRSCLILPLRASRGVVGVVCLADKASGRAFDEADLGPLRFLADQSAQTVENALQFRQMRDLATIDELTGLGNRRHFQNALEREIQRARRYRRQLSLALFDVDHFKQYNDACGHPAGDRALATLGRILRESLREVDIVARYGGEEFALILPETAPGAGTSPFPFLERLRQRVATEVFPGEESLPSGKLTISGGVACFPDDAETPDDLVQAADRALYVSKGRGRNSITYRDQRVSA
jgi:diguanylate cyclase (GGDEF)-like protein